MGPLRQDEHDRLTRISEVHTSDPDGIRRIPLGRIQAAATMRGAGLVQLMLAMGINEDPPASLLGGPPEGGLTLEPAIHPQAAGGQAARRGLL